MTLSKRVAGSGARLAETAAELTRETVLAGASTPAEERALEEAYALLKRAESLLIGVSSGRVEARARFVLFTKEAA